VATARRRPAERSSRSSLGATFLGVALAAALPLLLLVGWLIWSQATAERLRGGDEALARAEALAARVERHVAARLEGLAGMAAAVAASGNSPAVMEAQARRLRQAYPDVTRVLVVDDLGLVLTSVPPAADGRRGGLADRSWFRRAASSTEAFVEGARREGEAVVVGLHAPARTPEGHLRGVVSADLAVQQVQELLRGRADSGTVVDVVSGEGLILARQPPLYLLRDVSRHEGFRDLLRHAGGVGHATFEDGEVRLAGAAPVRAAGWLVVAGAPPAGVTAGVQRRALVAGTAALAVTALGLAAALALGRRHAQGMARLSAAMARVAGGDLPAGVPPSVGGEVGALTSSFNRMLTWLHGRVRDFEVLTEVGEAAGAAATASDASADRLLPGLLRKVVAGMGADAGVIVLREGADWLARAAVGFPGVPVEGVALRRGQGLVGAVVGQRASLVVADLEGDYRVEEPFLRAASLRTVAAAPVLSGDEVAGVLLTGWRVARPVGDPEVQRLEAMARRTAQAIDHARAVDAVRQSTQGLETRLAEQFEALQAAAREQAEARRQAQEARRQAQELERAMQRQAAQPPQVREVIVEKEVVRYAPAPGGGGGELRAELQKTVSEELRAPLSALLDLPRFLVEGLNKPLGQEERQQLEILRDRGEEILELIDGLVILSGLDAGQVTVARTAFDLPALIQRVIRTLQPRAAAKGNRIDADVKLGVGQVVSDPRRVEQVLANVLVNAIRYTEVGEIKVTVQPRDGEVVLTVGDDGAGFASEELDHVFEPFLQVGPREGRRLPGTGLHLTVARRLVEALGGRIRVESEVDRGTWVTVTLPVPE
jgi:signal transduction histidine kinase/HAMP domain-containing protein